MTWTNPPIVATGDFITAGLWNTYIRGNGLHLRGFLPDAGSSNQVLLSASTTTAAFSSTLPDALLASPKVAKAGDTMTGDLTVIADIYAHRSGTPTQGYIFFGTGAHWVGYTGSQFAFDGNTAWHSGNDGSGSGLDADTLDGTQLSSINAFLVPSGLIGGFETAGSIAAGWTRHTAMDGRIAVGAGTTAGVTFTEGATYGSSWSHSHATGWSSHAHGSAALTVTGSTGTESNSATFQSGAGASGAASAHTHPATSSGGTLDVGGTTDAAGGGGTSSDQWLPLMRAVVWAYKT